MTDSFVLQYLQNLIIRHRLSYLVFFVTSKCNAACTFCLRDRFPDAPETGENTELTIREINKIASHMHGLAHLLISGGEPFIRNDLDQIVRSFYVRSHTRFVTISTNGYFSDKIEDTVGRILRENGNLFLQIHISINGPQEVHDSTKRLPLSFAHLKETCGKLNKLKHSYNNLRLASITVLNDDSLKGKMAEFVELLKRDLFFLDNYYLTPVLQKSGFPIANPLLPEDTEAWARFKKRKRISTQRFWDTYAYCTLRRSQRLINRSMESGSALIPCAAGRKFSILKEDGTVFACEFPKFGTLGNIRDFQYDITGILSSDRARQIRDTIVQHKCYCCWTCAMNVNLVSRPDGCARILLDTVFYKLRLFLKIVKN